jgi:hypothetical protein
MTSKLDKVADIFGQNANGSLAPIQSQQWLPPTWNALVMNWSSKPTKNATAATSPVAGTVYNYVTTIPAYAGQTIYRLVPTTYSPANDAFYTTFTNGVLSGLIVARSSTT